MEKAEGFLMKSAALLCSAIYRMCRTALSKNGSEKVNDPKFLKEVGAALKEASSVLAGFQKKNETSSEEIKIVFETMDGEK